MNPVGNGARHPVFLRTNHGPKRCAASHPRLALLGCVLIALTWLETRVVLANEVQGLLPWSQQLAVREAWLVTRYQMLLPMMQRHRIDMWIIVNEEFHDDPLTQYIAPPRPYAGGRDYFVFIDAGASRRPAEPDPRSRIT